MLTVGLTPNSHSLLAILGVTTNFNKLRVTTTALNIDINIPKAKVVAKPLIEPVKNWIKIKQVIKNFEIERPILEQRIKEWCRDHNSVVSMVYFPPTLTSVSDLISYCDLLKVKYEGRAVLRSVYVDYLDLLKAGQIFDLHRLEMGQITIDMKVAAVMQNIPWVTVTQLNRGAYNPKEDLSLANMSESIKKVEHSDFVGILRNIENEADTNQDIRIPSEYGDFRIIIGKNRSGPKNATVNLKSIFSCSRIEDIDKSVAVPFINTDVMEGAFL